VRQVPSARARGLFVLAGVAAVTFVVLTVLVAAHATRDLDVAARDYFRPDDVWGTTQIRVDVVVEGLKPRNMVPLLGLAALLACLRRRSWRPAAYAVLLAGVAGAVTMLTKVLLERPDPHQDMTAVGGSYPSGHTVTVLICLGGAILVLQQRPRWWEWAVVWVAGVGMGLALLLQAAHWLTDVLGGLLLALAVLAAATGLRVRGTDRRLLGDDTHAEQPDKASTGPVR
jgi:membrane-associated phospholipid phosphatase